MIDDDLITRQVQLMRLSAGEKARVYAILRNMEEELVLALQKANLADISREDKARLLKQCQDLISEYYGDVSDEIGATLGEVGRLEATATAASLGNIYAGAIVPAIPPENVLKRIVDNTLIDGAPSAAWWKRQGGDVQFRFANAVRQGLAAGETNDQIIRRIRGRASGYTVVDGKRVYNYVGGVMDISRANAAAQVQTSVMSVAAQARQDTYEENDDIIKGYRQLSTLDSHTTPVCVAYSGATWDAKKQPTGSNKLPFISPKGSNTGTPRHWNCRSVIVPITKTFRELGIDVAEVPRTTRAASGGPVAADMTMEGFIKKKGDKFADDLLGPGRAQLYLEGKITLQQLVDQSGRPLTLKQLRKLYN